MVRWFAWTMTESFYGLLSRKEFEKRGQLFICMHNKPFSVAAMCVRNPDVAPRNQRLRRNPNSNRLCLISQYFMRGILARLLLPGAIAKCELGATPGCQPPGKELLGLDH
jgi:hypothetical protein